MISTTEYTEDTKRKTPRTPRERPPQARSARQLPQRGSQEGLSVAERGGCVAPGLALFWAGAALVAILLALGRWFAKNRELKRALLLALCLALLPLSMNCLFLVANVTVIHAITLYSFVCVYVLAIVVVETLEGKAARLGKDALITGLALVVLVNVVFANEVYLKLQLEYENAFATWTEIVTQIKLTEGFDEDTRIALVGKGTERLYQPDAIDTGDLLGPTDDLVNIYTRDALLRHYLGFDADFLSRDDAWLLSLDPRVEAMPLYPYPGSIQKIDDVIVVKFGNHG